MDMIHQLKNITTNQSTDYLKKVSLMNRIDEKIINLLNNKSIKNEDVLEYVKEKFKTSQLGNTTLGYLFEAYVGVVGWEDESKFISPDISMTELLAINDYFKTTNGCQWARTDQNYLGRKYNIIRTRSKGKVYSIKLNGLNDRPQRFRGIRKDIVSKIKNQNCVILDIGTNI